jgi:hypothetical protein
MKGEKKLRDTVRAVSLELIELQNRLYKVGMIKTAHAANATLKALGWEAAEKFKESK